MHKSNLKKNYMVLNAGMYVVSIIFSITICGNVIKEFMIGDLKSNYYALGEDEAADISGKEQLSIGLRFYDETKATIREEFVGFMELPAQTAPTIADEINVALGLVSTVAAQWRLKREA